MDYGVLMTINLRSVDDVLPLLVKKKVKY